MPAKRPSGVTPRRRPVPRKRLSAVPLEQLTKAQLIVALREALERSQGNLEEWATANEELIHVNEELLALNERLQQTGMDLQASNQELGVANQSLQDKVAQLAVARSDMENLLNATRVAAIFVDRELLITGVTPAASDIFSLSSNAVGRQIAVAVPSLAAIDVVEMAEQTIAELTIGEREFRAVDAGWYQVRSLPYRAIDGRIAGAVLTLVNLTARRAAEEVVEDLNRTLELRVADRTRALAESMQELETFSYSVAHDLRSPLRAIDGFSRVLVDEHSAQLGQEARHCLQRIRVGVGRMGELIDDLLMLAHVARVELRRRTVSLTALSNELVGELRRGDPSRTVQVTIAAGLSVEGDAPLLRAVLCNLIGNAWKFTRGRAEACVEVGAAAGPTGTTFFVRDNGVGFDMQYSDKLFVPFQRLHDLAEFEGSGIGLATVRRIVSRHGGVVWAEGVVNHGATFYFTLPGAH